MDNNLLGPAVVHMLHLRSESIIPFNNPATEDGEPFTAASASPPALSASSPQQHWSRSLDDAVMTMATASGDGAGDDGTSSLSRRARIGYLIMLSGVEELQKTKRLLKVERTSTRDDMFATIVNRAWNCVVMDFNYVHI